MSLPVIVFPDIELWATGAIRAALATRSESYTSSVYVGNKVPNPRRDRMVVIRRDGGPRLDLVREAARLGIRVWAKKEQDATDLARLVNGLLWASPDGQSVYKVTILSGPSWTTDESNEPVLYSTAELIVKGSPA